MDKRDKEMIGMTIVFILVMATLQLLLLWLTHWSVALIVPCLISFVIVIYVVGLGHATPNGGSYGPGAATSITPLLWVEGSLLCSLWLLCYLMKKPLPNMAVIVPLSLMLAFGIGQFVYSYIKIRSFWYKNYSLCKLEIENKTGSRSFIQHIKFNSSSRYSMDIDPHAVLWKTTYTPRDMDKISFRCHFANSNRSQVIEFPFDYTLCQEKVSYTFDWTFWITQKNILPMKLILLPDHKVALYIDNTLIQHYKLSEQDSLKSR